MQSPYASQSYNRYSYVLNNPLKYSDPSGYFFKKLFKGIAKAFRNVARAVKKHWRTIAAIAIMVFMPQMTFLEGLSAIQIGAITGFTAGVVSSGSLKGGIYGAIGGAAFGYVGSNIGEGFGRVLAHGIVGGTMQKLQGGKFGAGFLSAGFAQYASWKGAFAKLGEGATIASRIKNAVAAAVVGGTASVLGGGKFKNGAITGAFSRMLNDLNQAHIPKNASACPVGDCYDIKNETPYGEPYYVPGPKGIEFKDVRLIAEDDYTYTGISGLVTEVGDKSTFTKAVGALGAIADLLVVPNLRINQRFEYSTKQRMQVYKVEYRRVWPNIGKAAYKDLAPEYIEKPIGLPVRME